MPTAKEKKPARTTLRRQREKEQRYQTILGAAEALFVNKGYHQTGLEEIAEAAEVSVGTVYSYFKNKEDLLVSLMQKVGNHLRIMLQEAFLKKQGTLEGIVEAGTVFFKDFCLSHPGHVSIFFRESGGRSARVESERKRLYVKLISDLEKALVRVRSETGTNYLSAGSEELMAVCILGIYERVAEYYLLWHDRADDITTVGKEAVAFTVGGIKGLMADRLRHASGGLDIS